MAFVATKGGEDAIAAAHAWRADRRRGDGEGCTLRQATTSFGRAIDRVMAEGALYDPDLAARALLQAEGDLVEAAFLLRSYRATQPRLVDARPIDTTAMRVQRRVSAIFKDVLGGQRLGPTADYSHRLFDTGETAPESESAPAPVAAEPVAPLPGAMGILGGETLLEAIPAAGHDAPPADLTTMPLDFPASRPIRLQALARGDEGFLLSLAYSTQRGYGNTHPFVGELRMGEVAVSVVPPELGFAIEIGDIVVTECQMVNQFTGSKTVPPQFTRGYGLSVGHADRRAMSMALVERALRADELGEATGSPAQDPEFVLSHCDNIQATGFVEHLKLPHYVDFQSELEIIRAIRRQADEQRAEDGTDRKKEDGDDRI
ncbi:MAG: carbon-phosphorus lyase complex subunit PhnI [Gluconacetobacter sp.]